MNCSTLMISIPTAHSELNEIKLLRDFLFREFSKLFLINENV